MLVSAHYGLMLFRKICMRSSSVVSKLRGGIHIGRVPQDERTPYATIHMITTQPSDTKDAVSSLDSIQIQVDIWSALENIDDILSGYRAAAEADQAIRDAVDGFMGTLEDVYIDEIRFRTHNPTPFEDSTDRYRISTDYLMRIKRQQP